MQQPDIITVGGGHIGLVAAAYLAKAGKRALVLERKDLVGGEVSIRELNTPGFWHNENSSVYIMIQGNPMITRDELGLFARFGLRYRYSDILHASFFDDGSAILTYRDLDMTCETVAKVSLCDAEAYRRLSSKAMALIPLFLFGFY